MHTDRTGAGETDGGPGTVTRIRKPFDLDAIRTVVDDLLVPERTTSGNAT